MKRLMVLCLLACGGEDESSEPPERQIWVCQEDVDTEGVAVDHWCLAAEEVETALDDYHLGKSGWRCDPTFDPCECPVDRRFCVLDD